PMSPLIFLIAVRSLQIRLDHCLRGVQIGGSRVTNLFFADDCTIVLGEEDIEGQRQILRVLLKEFEKESGLKINEKRRK
ncbi:Putative LOC101743068, partial [Caligus rogercresseyi]